MATLSSIATHKLPQLTQSIAETKRPNCPSTALSTQLFNKSNPSNNFSFSTRKRRNWVIGSVTEDREVAPVKNNLAKDEEIIVVLLIADCRCQMESGRTNSNPQSRRGLLLFLFIFLKFLCGF
jgi:hypothetical protein